MTKPTDVVLNYLLCRRQVLEETIRISGLEIELIDKITAVITINNKPVGSDKDIN